MLQLLQTTGLTFLVSLVKSVNQPASQPLGISLSCRNPAMWSFVSDMLVWYLVVSIDSFHLLLLLLTLCAFARNSNGNWIDPTTTVPYNAALDIFSPLIVDPYERRGHVMTVVTVIIFHATDLLYMAVWSCMFPARDQHELTKEPGRKSY